MDKEQARKKLINNFESLKEIMNLSFYEVIYISKDKIDSYHKKSFGDVSFLSFEKVKEQNDFTSAGDNKVITLTLKSGKDGEIICRIHPLMVDNKISGYIIFQSPKKPDLVNEKLFGFFSGAMSQLEEIYDSIKPGTESKHREDIIGMRNIQAKLFPKFENVEGLDVASVYLPVELMTGNFIDAFNLNDNIYQIVACNITGYDATSSFAGATIRTLVRSFSSGRTVPSVLIELIIEKLQKIISGVHALIFITVYQFEKNSGRIHVSSYGEITTIFYSNKKKEFVSLNKTSTGRNFSKRNFFRDITFTLEHSDALLFYSGGTINATAEDGRSLYGEARLIETFKKNIETKSIDIIHSIAESIYKFTNYSQLEDDISLICIKRL